MLEAIRSWLWLGVAVFIAQNIKNKLKDINSINNGDLDLTNIQFDKTKRKFVKIN